ncbi:hypothetical protein Tco_0157835 [Tanacetum coccineum]
MLDANLLREALEIIPIDQAHPFVSPPSGDVIMDFVNELGYLEVIHFVSSMAVNHLYQPWRAILSMINQCLISKTSGHDRYRYCKNLKKTVKTGQSRTRERKSTQRAGRMLSRSTKVNHGQA